MRDSAPVGFAVRAAPCANAHAALTSSKVPTHAERRAARSNFIGFSNRNSRRSDRGALQTGIR
jgi:hypothetical protein